jgi:hypothetical protein
MTHSYIYIYVFINELKEINSRSQIPERMLVALF